MTPEEVAASYDRLADQWVEVSAYGFARVAAQASDLSPGLEVILEWNNYLPLSFASTSGTFARSPWVVLTLANVTARLPSITKVDG
jgi:hypothetical protein